MLKYTALALSIRFKVYVIYVGFYTLYTLLNFKTVPKCVKTQKILRLSVVLWMVKLNLYTHTPILKVEI